MEAVKKFFLFLIFLFSLGYAASSHAAQWDFAGWEGGGCYPNVEWDAKTPGRVYVTSDVAGIWRSDDKGEHWNFITQGLGNLNVAVLAIAPSDSRILYAGTRDGVYVSRNSGDSWEACGNAPDGIRFKRPENYKSIVVSHSDPSRLVIGTASGEVLYSDDFGARWSALADVHDHPAKKSPVTAIYWNELGQELWAASESGLNRYSFSEKKWFHVKNGPISITDLCVDEKNPNIFRIAAGRHLWVTENMGSSWTRRAEIPPAGNLFRICSVVVEGKPALLAAYNNGWDGDLLLSTDEGASWQAALKKNFPDKMSNPTRVWAGSKGRINSLKADPFDPSVVIRTDWWGIWRSDDGGRTWHEKIKGAPNTVASDITVSPAGEIYVATMDNGLLKSMDGGDTYKPVFPVKGYAASINGHVWRVALFDEKRLLATSFPWNDKRNQIVLSDDGGGSFSRSRAGLPDAAPRRDTVWGEGYARAIAIDPKNSRRVYLGIDGEDGGGLFISDDAGASWRRSKGQPDSKRIYNGLVLDPLDTRRIYWGATGENGGIYLSEDEGNTWKKVSGDIGEVFDIASDAEGIIYAGTGDKGACLYRSADRGSTWSLVKRFSNQGAVDALCLISSPEKMLALGEVRWNDRSGGRIYLFNIEKNRWLDITGNLPNGTGPAAMAWSTVSQRLYEASYAGSVYRTSLPAEDSWDAAA